MKRDRHERRAVMMSGGDATTLEGTAAMLERRNFKKEAQCVRDLVARFDGGEGFTAIHRSAFELVAVEGEGPA